MDIGSRTTLIFILICVGFIISTAIAVNIKEESKKYVGNVNILILTSVLIVTLLIVILNCGM